LLFWRLDGGQHAQFNGALANDIKFVDSNAGSTAQAEKLEGQFVRGIGQRWQ
jgi:hypothetical protein